jgi:hypothetical protein
VHAYALTHPPSQPTGSFQKIDLLFSGSPGSDEDAEKRNAQQQTDLGSSSGSRARSAASKARDPGPFLG